MKTPAESAMPQRDTAKFKTLSVSRPRRLSRPLMVAALVALAGVAIAPGCATQVPTGRVAADSTGAYAPAHVALAPLARMAERERRRPVREATRLPAPPGIDEVLAQRIEEGERSTMPLKEALQQFAVEAEPLDAGDDPGDQERDTALRRYLRGRQLLADGDAGAAIDDLRQATRLDPGAAEPWRELGEAALALGMRSEAISAFRSAIERGIRDARLFELLGRDALERRDYESALEYLARAALAEPAHTDPLLPAVIDVNLARALAAQGYIVAARDAIARALEQRSPAASATRYMQEYGAIFRRQGDLWREVGDAHARLGRFDDALEAYRRAAELPSLDEEALTARMVFAALRAGRPAAAALSILSDIVDSGGLATEGDIAMLRHIAGASGEVRWNSPVRLETAAALANLRASLGEDPPPSVRASLTRAQAAVLNPPAARPILRELITGDAPNVAAARDLVFLCEDARDAAREAAQVIAARPDAAGEMAEALLLSSFDVDELLEHLTERPAPGPRLLAASHIQAKRGLLEKAADLVDKIGEERRDYPPVVAARLEFAIGAGRDADWRELLDVSHDSPAMARIVARAMALVQRHDGGIELLLPYLDETAEVSRRERLESLLLAGEVAMAAGRSDQAERWLRRAVALDVHDERAYAQLLAFYGPSGPAPDANRSNHIVRELRQHVPESRTANLLLARELARRGLLPQAETAALDLATDRPDLAALEILASVWQMQAARGDGEALERGHAWLDELGKRRVHAPALLAARTTMLVGAGHMSDAAVMLEEALDDGAGRDAARLYERILREGLGRRTEADDLTIQRLAGRELIPADAIELAEAQARRGRLGEAIESLRPAMEAEVTLAGDLAGRLVAIADPIARRAIQSEDDEQRWTAIGLFDRIVERQMPLTAQLHELRIDLLVRFLESDLERVDAAIQLAIEEHPVLRTRLHAAAAQTAASIGRDRLALGLLRIACAQPDPERELIAAWFLAIVSFGDADDARGLIDDLYARQLLARLFSPTEDEEELDDYRSLTAMEFAMHFSREGRDDEAIELYETSLQYDPDNGWACNNLGYMLLERRQNLERADELLTRAIQLLPDEPPVIDSLGWLRYVQGKFEDEVDPETGEVVSEGAVTLLRRAAEKDQNPVIVDHYGDALWRAGRIEEAQAQWRAARDNAAARLQANERARARMGRRAPMRDAVLLSPTEEQEFRDIVASTRAKIGAIDDGTRPPVAPLYAEADREPEQLGEAAGLEGNESEEPAHSSDPSID